MSRLHLPLFALLLAVAAGCGKNSASTLLVPSGIRPAPTVPTGGLWGNVLFANATYPDLTTAPFPPATVQVFSGSSLVRTTTTDGTTQGFRIEQLPPGDYSLVVRSHAFNPAQFGPYRVVDRVRDAGDLALSPNTVDSLGSLLLVVGTMPNYDAGTVLLDYSSVCANDTVGVFVFDSRLDFYGSPRPVTAGTHRLKFVTDVSSTDGHLIGWGGRGDTTLTAPVRGVRARYGNGPSTDLVVQFPTTGQYRFRFDERRQTIDIVPVSAATAPVRALVAGRTPRPTLPRR